MRTFFTPFILLLAAASFGTAQDASLTAALGELPKCALACLVSAASNSTCGITDTTCQCTNAEFVAASELCVMGSCSVKESLVAQNVTKTLCGAPVRDKSVEYDVVSTTLVVTAAVTVVIRLGYKQFFTQTGLSLDDWLILATLLNSIPSAAMNIQMTKNGLGKDIWTLTPESITNFAKYFYIIAILYFSEVFLLKLSMLFFYLKIFPAPGFRRLIWGTVAFDVMFGIAFVFAAIFQCQPISYNWTNWTGEGGGQCVNINAIAWVNAAVSIAVDLWMLALPLSQLPSLNLHWKKKVGVGIMFCVGTFVTVVSAIRLSSLIQFRKSYNLTWDYWGVSLWSTVEIAVGIICACLPSIRLILVRFFPKIFDVTSRRITWYYGNNRQGQSGYSNSQPSKNRYSVRASWRPNYRASWRASKIPHDKMMVDGIQFSSLSPPPMPSLGSQSGGDEEGLVPTYQVEISSTGKAPRRSSILHGTRLSSRASMRDEVLGQTSPISSSFPKGDSY